MLSMSMQVTKFDTKQSEKSGVKCRCQTKARKTLMMMVMVTHFWLDDEILKDKHLFVVACPFSYFRCIGTYKIIVIIIVAMLPLKKKQDLRIPTTQQKYNDNINNKQIPSDNIITNKKGMTRPR